LDAGDAWNDGGFSAGEDEPDEDVEPVDKGNGFTDRVYEDVDAL
jgi:hypothetical protein